ncbi:uncharacterized protein EI90DRAFT_3125103 [Cantharellus anzutake]|uniref:uncharacterized protein n=1 Tax=Cantharellus anzutake TaxID=1750568 RepID=UPI001903A832|nr:uncharacterized protein EI90DRAFT_3125103 [Cantharellus anzutake]KAF8329840.1 hypothetical protein EI90DRAFT_3125103 [Cantharellus anzutake]
MTLITSTSPRNLSLLLLVDANDPRTTSSFNSLPPFLRSVSTSPPELLHCSGTSGHTSTLTPLSGPPTVEITTSVSLKDHMQIPTPTSGPPLPYLHLLGPLFQKDMDLGHLLVVGNPQLVYPSTFLLLVSTPPAPPVMYLQYLPTPTLPPVTLFLIVLSFDIFYNPNIPDYNFQAPDSSRHLPL